MLPVECKTGNEKKRERKRKEEETKTKTRKEKTKQKKHAAASQPEIGRGKREEDKYFPNYTANLPLQLSYSQLWPT